MLAYGCELVFRRPGMVVAPCRVDDRGRLVLSSIAGRKVAKFGWPCSRLSRRIGSALRVTDRLRQQHVLVVAEAKSVGDG